MKASEKEVVEGAKASRHKDGRRDTKKSKRVNAVKIGDPVSLEVTRFER